MLFNWIRQNAEMSLCFSIKRLVGRRGTCTGSGDGTGDLPGLAGLEM